MSGMYDLAAVRRAASGVGDGGGDEGELDSGGDGGGDGGGGEGGGDGGGGGIGGEYCSTTIAVLKLVMHARATASPFPRSS